MNIRFAFLLANLCIVDAMVCADIRPAVNDPKAIAALAAFRQIPQERLAANYHAIAAINSRLKALLAESESRLDSGIELSGTNPFYGRSNYLVLCTVENPYHRDGEASGGEIIQKLFTPFGQAELFHSGLASDILHMSQVLLKDTQWKLLPIDARTVPLYAYFNINGTDRILGPRHYSNPPNLYLVTRVQEHQLVLSDDVVHEDVTIFYEFHGSEEYTACREQIKTLSCGTGKF